MYILNVVGQRREISTKLNMYIYIYIYIYNVVQILDLTDCISHSTNTLGKGMNPIILPSALVRQVV